MTPSPLKKKLYQIIFGTGTPAGRNFDILLIIAILLSVTVVIIASIESYRTLYGWLWFRLEWGFTLLFTLEYIVRLYCSPKRLRYAISFYGIVDLLAILPTYIGLLFPATSYLMIVRLLRVLRIFRILKLYRYLKEANVLIQALHMARRRIFIFLFSILVVVTVFGSLMFVVEGPTSGFTSIPESIYWAIVTVTTVGYGDITPHTTLGQFISALAMLTGYAIIAIVTGIFSAELIIEIQREQQAIRCRSCRSSGHNRRALFCQFCGANLEKSIDK